MNQGCFGSGAAVMTAGDDVKQIGHTVTELPSFEGLLSNQSIEGVPLSVIQKAVKSQASLLTRLAAVLRLGCHSLSPVAFAEISRPHAASVSLAGWRL